MIIQSANINFTAQHALNKSRETKTSLEITPSEPRRRNPTVPVSQVNTIPQSAAPALAESSGSEPMPSNQVDIRYALMKGVMESFTGKKIEIYNPSSHRESVAVSTEESSLSISSQAGRRQSGSVDFSIEYQRVERYSEEESSSFSATGDVVLASGESVKIDLKSVMERSYSEETTVNIQIGGKPKQVDPLVINLTRQNVQLSAEKYDFDLNADGQTEKISFTTQGSGFLALDKNSDGVINDGSELFGPKTGQGFNELAAFDQDGNNFIDEADDVYDRLRVFSKNSKGEDELVSLRDGGVGAIFLGSANTPFELKDADNNQNGQVKRSGIYLREDLTTGSVQEIDLTV
jgi:hypothetical protein